MATASKKSTKSSSSSKSTSSASGTKAKKAKKLQPVPTPGELPIIADVTFVTSTPLPAPMSHPPMGNLGYVFNDANITVLTGTDVSSYFGAPLQASTLQADATAANQAAVARDHFTAGQEAAALLYNGPGSRLLARLTVVMDRWDAFSTAYPTEAQQLASLRAAWVAAHPGRSKKATASTAAPTPAAPAVGASAPSVATSAATVAAPAPGVGASQA